MRTYHITESPTWIEIIFISLAEVISFHMQTNNYVIANSSRADII